MKVHTSNFRVEGFTEEASAREIAALASERGLPSAFDLGSGLLEIAGEPPIAGLESEPGVRAAVASGVDVVSFSGDKLLGAPQSGLIVGKRAAVEAMRKNPVYRALRLDKVTIAGLERTLELYLAGRAGELPARAMLAATADELRPIAERIAKALDAVAGLRARVEDGESQPGSGSAPGVFLPTFVVRIEHAKLEAGALAARLRDGEPPVFARVQDRALFLDPRTLFSQQVDALIDALRRAAT
jgi:L-seryl-tRNA(Ser) seleniumtransferase